MKVNNNSSSRGDGSSSGNSRGVDTHKPTKLIQKQRRWHSSQLQSSNEIANESGGNASDGFGAPMMSMTQVRL